MESLEISFWEYFEHLPKHVSQWNKTVDEMVPYLKAFKNQCEQYRLVKSKKWNDEKILKLFPNIETKLMEKLLNGIEQEMLELRKFQNTLAALNKDLFRKQDAIYKSTKIEEISRFTSKGAIAPPTYILIELSENTRNYYSVLYLQLDIAFCGLKYEEQISVSELELVILKLCRTSDEIKDILALTIFCRK